MPERYGARQTIYKRYVQWQEAGLLEQIFHDLGADADLQDISIDSIYIKSCKASAGAAKKGNAHDVAVAEKLLSAIAIKGSRVLADKAYGAFRIREYIAAHQSDYCIPPKSNE